jgi:hypothetical protein
MLKTEQTMVLRSPSLSGDKKQFAGAVMPSTDFSEIDLSGYDFRFANLRGCSFLGATLQGADFYGADLRDCEFESTPFFVASSQLCIGFPDGLGHKVFEVHISKTIEYTTTVEVKAFTSDAAEEKACSMVSDGTIDFPFFDEERIVCTVGEDL